VAWQCPNVTFVATTNRRLGVDAAFLSRADAVEEIGYPGADAILEILRDTLGELSPDALGDTGGLRDLADACAAADIDARQVRKLVLRAVCSRRDLALAPGRLTVADVAATFALGRAAAETLAGA
jgi:pachytene checkpoint protein 2